jgi:type II restriction enzyme
MTLSDAKKMLDSVIKKARNFFYKPIQIAEILYQSRIAPSQTKPSELETYRNPSKQWRDTVTQRLIGQKCTSSQKFQDHLFDAITPDALQVLSTDNVRLGGAIEAYIYTSLGKKLTLMSTALDYCTKSDKSTFQIRTFLGLFAGDSRLAKSTDKVYEIVVYALFVTLTDALDFSVKVQINQSRIDIIKEFEDFAYKILQVGPDRPFSENRARVFRVGVTNAADCGIDMYSTWGPAIQVKHITLDENRVEEIAGSIDSDRIVIVCRDSEQRVIASVLTQLGWKSRIQSIVTESDLVRWYEKALRGKYSQTLGDVLLEHMRTEIAREFPSLKDLPGFMKERKYDVIMNRGIWLFK